MAPTGMSLHPSIRTPGVGQSCDNTRGAFECQCDLKHCFLGSLWPAVFYCYLFFQPWYFNEIFIFKANRKQRKAGDASSSFC